MVVLMCWYCGVILILVATVVDSPAMYVRLSLLLDLQFLTSLLIKFCSINLHIS